MDFASLMKSQIGASKPKASEDGGEKKFLKRSEIEAKRQADYLKEQEELEKARIERLEKKRKRDEEEAEQRRAKDEKRRRLAEESKKRAEEEAEAEERARRKRLGLPELEKAESGSKETTPAKDEERFGAETALVSTPKMSAGPIPTTLELVPEAEMKVPSSVPTDTEGQKYLIRQIASYFDMLLSEWQRALSRRTKEVKESFEGRNALKNYQTALSNLTPLFRKMESGTLPLPLLGPILEITHLAQLKRYVDANDAYLRLSIGKAAWPIGVTMVGIHERSAREKLHETEKGKGDEKAHILADETTRKMLQGIKRCLSYAQTRWPPEDLGQLMG